MSIEPTTESADLIFGASECTIQAAGARSKQPRLAVVAYTGGPMRPLYRGLTVIDLAGLQLPVQVPVLADHENSVAGIVGHAVPKIERNQLVASGNIVRGTDAADRIVELGVIRPHRMPQVAMQHPRSTP